MKKILIAEEKHGSRYFDASTPELLHAAALKLVSERIETEYFAEPKTELNRLRDTLKTRDGKYAWLFLMERRDAEYEGVTIENIEEL